MTIQYESLAHPRRPSKRPGALRLFMYTSPENIVSPENVATARLGAASGSSRMSLAMKISTNSLTFITGVTNGIKSRVRAHFLLLRVVTNFLLKAKDSKELPALRAISNSPFPHSTSVRTNNRTRARLGWTFSYICCIFVQPNLDSVPLFVGMRGKVYRLNLSYSFFFYYFLGFFASFLLSFGTVLHYGCNLR